MPHSIASKHHTAAVSPIRRGNDSVLVRMSAAGTAAARNTEP